MGKSVGSLSIFAFCHERFYKPEIIDKPRIFGSRLVEELKKDGQNSKRNAVEWPIIMQTRGLSEIYTKPPTEQRFSQPWELSLLESIPDLIVYTPDISQAYVKSHTLL